MNHTAPSSAMPSPKYSSYLKWISNLSGQDASDKSIGPAIGLKVEAGDKIDIETWAKYKNKTSYSRSDIVGAMASILGGSFVGSQAGLEILSNATQTFQNGISLAVGVGGNGNDVNTRPYAYVYYLLYDRSFNPITQGWKRVSTSAGFDPGMEAFSTHEKLTIPTVNITEPGYIYVFVSNESENTEVWFDDLKVAHERSKVVAGADYYPFGLVMENREITREDYRYGYQGQFSEKDLTNGWNEFEVRNYDPRIGKWLSLDEVNRSASRYTAMGNNPTIYGDPDGRDIILLNDAEGAILGAGHSALLIGDDKNGWVLISKEGRRKDLPSWKSNELIGGPALPPVDNEYRTFEDFLNDEDFNHYERGIRFKTTHEQDLRAIEQAREDAQTWYHFRYNNCGHTCDQVLQDAGIKKYNMGPGDDLFTPNESFNRYKAFLNTYNGAVDMTPIIKQARDLQLQRGALQIGLTIARGLSIGKAIIRVPRFVPTSIF